MDRQQHFFFFFFLFSWIHVVWIVLIEFDRACTSSAESSCPQSLHVNFPPSPDSFKPQVWLTDWLRIAAPIAPFLSLHCACGEDPLAYRVQIHAFCSNFSSICCIRHFLLQTKQHRIQSSYRNRRRNSCNINLESSFLLCPSQIKSISYNPLETQSLIVENRIRNKLAEEIASQRPPNGNKHTHARSEQTRNQPRNMKLEVSTVHYLTCLFACTGEWRLHKTQKCRVQMESKQQQRRMGTAALATTKLRMRRMAAPHSSWLWILLQILACILVEALDFWLLDFP